MFKKGVFLVVALAIVFSLSACGPSPQEATPTPAPTPEEVELKYDDGISDGRCSSGQQGFLVRFLPAATPLTINKVKVFANIRGTADQERKPKLEIWDKDSSILYVSEESYARFGSEPGWVTIEIPQITVNDDFFVVFYTNSRRDNGIYIHYDLSVKNRYSDMVKDGSIIDWIWGDNPPKEKTNWMIRILGKPGGPNTATPSESGSSEVSKNGLSVPSTEPVGQIGNWELTYEVKITKGSNMAEVIVHLDDPADNVNNLYLRTKPDGPFLVPDNYINNLRSEGGTVIEDKSLDNGYTWEVAGIKQAKLLYTVNLNVRFYRWPYTNREGYSGFASSDWAITAGGLLFVPISWSGTSSYPNVILKLDIPDEWESYVPYPETAQSTYDVTGLCTRIRPRSFIVMGKASSFDVARQETTDTEFTVVAINTSAIAAQEHE